MKNFLAACITVFFFVACEEDKASSTDMLNFIPENSSYILDTPSLSGFFSSLETTIFFGQNEDLFDPSLKYQLQNISELTDIGSALICFSKENDQTQYLVISKTGDLTVNIDSVKNRSVETLQIEGIEIKKYVTEEITTFTSNTAGHFLASNSSDKLIAAISNSNGSLSKNASFQKAMAAKDESKSSLFINHRLFDPSYHKMFPDNTLPLTPLSEWSVLDLDLDQDQIRINGISASNEEKRQILDIFDETGVENNQIAEITPGSAAGFYSFTYSDFRRLQENLQSFRRDSLKIPEDHVLHFTRESGIIFHRDQKILVFTTTDPDLALEALPAPSGESVEFRGIPIYENANAEDYSRYLNPLIGVNDHKFYAFLDQFLIYAETIRALEEIITNFKNNSTLEHQEYYKTATSNLAESSSLFFVANTSQFQEALKKAVSADFLADVNKLDLENYSLAAIQFVKEDGYAHIHGILNNSTPASQSRLQQTASIELQNALGTNPSLIRNHQNNQLEIAVQDENNNLYLFSRNGDLLWKKQLESRILGEIHQVDLFKNGNLQLAFSTQNSVQVLDRNSNPVKPFPLEFNDAITQPLSVFDYDNNRNYRFVVTQTDELLMFGPKGKRVRGFDFRKAGSEILQSPAHIRMNNKDYIVFPESSGKLKILSRQGKSRISVKENIDFSQNGWFQNQNKFVSATADGNLVKIDEQGNVNLESLTSGTEPKINATPNILVSLHENILNINGKEISLDYGLYTDPQIFQSGGKTLISVTDTQAQKVYLFDQNGELLPGFPVYGTSEIDLMQLNGNNYAITVKGEDNRVLVYTLVEE